MSKTIEEIKDEYANEISPHGWFVMTMRQARITDAQVNEVAERYAQSQTQELTAWKESASKVFKNLDLQAIGKTLGIGLGEDVSTNVLPKIKELQEQNAKLVEMYKECFEMFIPSDKWDEATEFLSTYGSGLAKDLSRKEKHNHLNKKT